MNDSPKRPMFPAWAWAAAVALAVITGVSVRQMQVDTSQLVRLRHQMEAAQAQNRALQDQLELGRMVTSVMLAPDSRAFRLMPANPILPPLHAYLHPQMGIALTAEQVREPPNGRTLQLWCVPRKGDALSVAIFRPSAGGAVEVLAPLKIPLEEVAALIVTEEPAGGSPQPGGSPAWSAQIR